MLKGKKHATFYVYFYINYVGQQPCSNAESIDAHTQLSIKTNIYEFWEIIEPSEIQISSISEQSAIQTFWFGFRAV